MNSLKGHLLVASPRMEESPFAKSVILLLHHGPEGAFGLILNRPIDETINGLWSKISEDPPVQIDRHLHMGGPVQGPLLALHLHKALGEYESLPGLYVAAEKGHLDTLVHESAKPYRLYIGHAGWGKDQLEQELAAGAWHVMPADHKHVFSDDPNLWREALQEIGWSTIRNSLNIKHVPMDVSWN